MLGGRGDSIARLKFIKIFRVVGDANPYKMRRRTGSVGDDVLGVPFLIIPHSLLFSVVGAIHARNE